MSIFTKPCIVAVLLFWAVAPLLHQFLHSGEIPSERLGALHLVSNDRRTDQVSLMRLPELSAKRSNVRDAVTTTSGNTNPQLLAVETLTQSKRSLGDELIEVGSYLNADDPVELAQWEYEGEINMGPPMSPNAPLSTAVYAPEEPLDIENRRPEKYGDVITIGPKIDADAYR